MIDTNLGRGVALAACVLALAWIVVDAEGVRVWWALAPGALAVSFAGMLAPKRATKKKASGAG